MSSIKKIYIDDKYIIRDKSTSDGSQVKYFIDNRWYKQDYFGGEAESEYSKSFSPNFKLNYNFLKKYCTINLDKEKAIELLKKNEDTIQKKVLEYQLGYV